MNLLEEVVLAILPGVSEKDLKFTVQGNQLAIEGERRAPEHLGANGGSADQRSPILRRRTRGGLREVTRRDWLYSTILALPVAPSKLAAQSGSRPLLLTRGEMEQFLRTAEITKLRSLSTGITNSQRATLTDGFLTHDAHVQTVDEREPIHRSTAGTYVDFTDTYKHNIAAYRLDKMLGMRMTPVSIERRVHGRRAAVTWWVDDVLMSEKDRYTNGIETPDPDQWNRQIYCVRVFDELIYNIDRNLGNLLITHDWTVWMIDHTRAFRPEKRLKDPDNLVRCDRRLLEALTRLTLAALRSELGEYVDESRLEGLIARRDQIIEFFGEEVHKKGEARVLYDYLPRPEAIQIPVATQQVPTR